MTAQATTNDTSGTSSITKRILGREPNLSRPELALFEASIAEALIRAAGRLRDAQPGEAELAHDIRGLTRASSEWLIGTTMSCPSHAYEKASLLLDPLLGGDEEVEVSAAVLRSILRDLKALADAKGQQQAGITR